MPIIFELIRRWVFCLSMPICKQINGREKKPLFGAPPLKTNSQIEGRVGRRPVEDQDQYLPLQTNNIKMHTISPQR